jgi:serine protease Do
MKYSMTPRTHGAGRCASYVLSAALLVVAMSNWTRPAPATAQEGTRRQVAGRTEPRAQATLQALEDAFVSVADGVEPAVVTIMTRADRPAREDDPEGDPDEPRRYRRRFRGPDAPEPGAPRSPRPTGSGVIIQQSGGSVYVLTNNHVVDGADEVRIRASDRSEYAAERVGQDAQTDLAVLRFQPARPLPAAAVARFGDSDRVRVGQWAIAIGSPLGYESTLTVGVISAKGRQLPGRGRRPAPGDLVQTDASINPGNSGGPLVNISGEVVGINVAIASAGMSAGNIGIGFAIPADTARTVSQQLIASGRVARGYLGIQVGRENRDLTPETRERLGVPSGGALLAEVVPGAPAGMAGLQGGDVIVKFGERVIRSFTDLDKAIAATPPGTVVPVEVVRDGRRLRLELTPSEQPAEPSEPAEGESFRSRGNRLRR